MNDQDLKVICGTDGALYLIFIRYAALLFLGITVINTVIFVPIYSTGFPVDEKDIQDEAGRVSIVSLISFLNITGTQPKITAIYILSTLLYSSLAFVLVFCYWKKSASWRFKKHSHTA